MTVIDLAWTGLVALALLWPSRFIGVLDGAPLDGRAEALVMGLAIPALWWLDRRPFTATGTRVLIVTLLLWKIATGFVAGQQGLCAATFAPRPIDGTAMTMRIQEPSGALRSWDVRADWRSPSPACTAILTRSMPALNDFPAWFLNLTDQILGARDFTMKVSGYVTTGQARTLTIDIGRDMRIDAHIDGSAVTGAPVQLAAGTHAVDLSLHLSGEAWRFDPRLDGEPLWDRALVTTTAPTGFDRVMASWAWAVAPLLTLALVAGMAAQVFKQMRPSVALLAWVGASAAAAALLAWLPATGWQRAAGVIGLGAAVLPLRASLRNMKTAFLAIGVPWLTFFAVLSRDQIGRFSIYSTDDWLAYQAAGYRIFMNGYWLEGGTPAFDYQPLYRWMTGALHLLFGDSSVGEVYWDTVCLLIGALLAFHIVRTAAGFRWGLIAAALTLATITLGTPWYFLGRGLSEIAAAGFAFLAMFLLLRGRRGSHAWVAAGAVMAVLMFYSRLNHLLWAAFLPAMLLPLRAPAIPVAIARAFARVRLSSLAIYAAVFSGGVVLFMLRTWYYTGAFSLFYGTSLRHNDTGLRPWTVFDAEAWAKVAHSLASFAWLNEPPRFDPRALVMIAGVLVAVAAVLQVPVARRVPGSLVLVAAGASLGAFFAHAHGYPGRFSIHAVPLASALAICGVKRWRR
jgi:hypothetical protein